MGKPAAATDENHARGKRTYIVLINNYCHPRCGDHCLSSARMAKTKKNRRGMAEKAASKPKSAVKRLNPFDVRFVKNPKQTVIGRKVKKDVGKPGQARIKATCSWTRELERKTTTCPQRIRWLQDSQPKGS